MLTTIVCLSVNEFWIKRRKTRFECIEIFNLADKEVQCQQPVLKYIALLV